MIGEDETQTSVGQLILTMVVVHSESDLPLTVNSELSVGVPRDK
jgi:hypothetical protein